jgi:hypothetical protein
VRDSSSGRKDIMFRLGSSLNRPRMRCIYSCTSAMFVAPTLDNCLPQVVLDFLRTTGRKYFRTVDSAAVVDRERNYLNTYSFLLFSYTVMDFERHPHLEKRLLDRPAPRSQIFQRTCHQRKDIDGRSKSSDSKVLVLLVLNPRLKGCCRLPIVLYTSKLLARRNRHR